MKLHLQYREMVEIALARQFLRLAADGDRYLGVVLAVDLIGPEPFQTVDDLVDARLDLCKAIVLIGQRREPDPGDAVMATKVPYIGRG